MPDPTRQDSLNLLKSTRELDDYYKRSGNYDLFSEKDVNYDFAPDSSEADPLGYLKRIRDEFDERYKEGKSTNVVQKDATTKGFLLDPSYFYKNLSGDTFEQRESANNVLDLSSPMARYHNKIVPTSFYQYAAKNNPDIVGIYGYDELAITPADMQSDSEIIKRVNKYGTSGVPASRLKALGLPLPKEPVPKVSEASKKRKENRDLLDQQLKEAGLYNRATGITGRNPEASRMYEEYMRSKQPSQPSVTQVPNQVQSAGEVIKQPIEERIPEGYQLNLGYRGADGRYYGNTYNPTTSKGETYPVPGAPTMEDYKRIRAAELNPKRTGTRAVRADFAYGGPINNDGPLAQPQGDIYLPLDGTRPSYIDASGKERSEYKIGVGTKEGEMVIPTVWNGKQHTEDEAIDRYYNTGEHMGGPYGSIEEGERAAKLRTFLYNEHPAYSKKAYGGCAPKYAQGGQLYEAEGGEVIDGGNPITLQGGHISPNSSNSGKIVGNSHGNGGVKMTGGEKIYSDRLTVDTSFLKDLDI